MKLFLAREHTRKLLFYTKLRDNEVKITDIEIYIYIFPHLIKSLSTIIIWTEIILEYSLLSIFILERDNLSSIFLGSDWIWTKKSFLDEWTREK